MTILFSKADEQGGTATPARMRAPIIADAAKAAAKVAAGGVGKDGFGAMGSPSTGNFFLRKAALGVGLGVLMVTLLDLGAKRRR